MTPPSGRTVLLDTVASIAAYGAALAAVTFADPALPREGSIVGGVLVWSIVYPVIHVAVVGEWPRLFGRRPWRYSLPNAVGLLAATAVYWAGFDAPDTFALVFALLIAGQGFSQVWWSVGASKESATASA